MNKGKKSNLKIDKKRLMICGAVLLILIFLIIFIFGKDGRVIKKNDKQIGFLPYLYLDFFSTIDTGFISIYFDDSCMENFVNGKEYKEEDQGQIYAVQLLNNVDGSTHFDYDLITTYSKFSKVLTVEIKNRDNTQNYIQKYQLDVKNGNVTYEKLGKGEGNFDFAKPEYSDIY